MSHESSIVIVLWFSSSLSGIGLTHLPVVKAQRALNLSHTAAFGSLPAVHARDCEHVCESVRLRARMLASVSE